MVIFAAESLAIPILFFSGSMMLAALLPIMVALGWVMWLRTQGHEALRQCNRGADLLDRGHLDSAAGIFDEVLANQRAVTHILPIAAYHRARVELYRGNLDEARERLERVIASGWFEPRRMLQALAPQVYSTLSLTAGLQGDLEMAERTRTRGKAAPSNLERWWYFPDAVLDLRHDRPAEFIHRLEQQRDDIEATLSGRALRQLQLFEAFALAQLGEREHNYRGLHSGTDIEVLLHGVRPGMFDYMTTRWPQLREFMQVHRLLAR